ncbi:hypothetical protein NVP1215B_054 [Vibrio phage 1.215.B._10N.222.54.F7]|nr:hypothetical protein NVP1215A_054 [Vibrio phage 1.215.A._10N.222.54.F7]AUR96077.1 hypothetical protein NVP1215B_054 [Vibrio phage 1.215.B._10N.222.54.F7]
MSEVNKIPTDPAEINDELDQLLDLTPQTSDRGRLFWLIKAALDNLTQGTGTTSGEPFSLGTYTVSPAGTTGSTVAATPGASIISNEGTLALSGINTETVNIAKAIHPFVLTTPDLVWTLALINHTNPAEYSYDAKIRVIPSGTDHALEIIPLDKSVVNTSTWSPGDLFTYYLLPSTSGAGKPISRTSVYRNSDPEPYTVVTSTTSPLPLASGKIAFEATNINDITSVKSVYIAQGNPKSQQNDLLAFIANFHTDEAESLGNLIFHGKNNDQFFDKFACFKITAVANVSGTTKFDIIPDPKSIGSASSFDDLDGTFEWVFMPNDIAKKPSGGGGAVSTAFKLGEWIVEDINASIPNNNPVPVGQISLTSPVPGGGDFVSMSLVDANGLRASMPFYGQYGQYFELMLWDEAGDTTEQGDKYKSVSFRVNPNSTSTSGNQINFYEVMDAPNSGNVQLVPGKKYSVFMIPVTSDLIPGLSNTIGSYVCSSLSILSNVMTGNKIEANTKDVENVTTLRISNGSSSTKLHLLALKVSDRIVITANGVPYLYEITALTRQTSNGAFLLTVSFIDQGDANRDLILNGTVNIAKV